MGNLRIKNVQIIDSTNISVSFTDILTKDLVVGNVSIISDTDNSPNAQVLGIVIKKDTININCQPLTSFATYFLQFQSTASHQFTSLHGDNYLLEDGVANKYMIFGPMSSDNPIQDYLKSYFQNNIYDISDGTIINKHIQNLSIVLSRALYDIRQSKNDNYLSFSVVDEQKTRGAGPFDRLNEEGAYEMLRLGLAPTSANAFNTFQFDSFPDFPVTLQKQNATELLKVDSTDDIGIFNINTLILNLSNSPVTKLTGLVFTFSTVNPIYVYDIESLGYQIKNSRYDQDFAFNYNLLKDNQIKINEKILENSDFALNNIVSIQAQYEYKNLGIIIDNNSLNIFTVKSSIRESLPPIINIFDLDFAPIVDDNGDTQQLNGIVFTDPNNLNGNIKHPAFKQEIPFRFNGLPSMPGQYAIDYELGRVYVYGADSKNDGTGAFPPLATYKYKFIYKNQQDYVYDQDLLDLCSLPLGTLVNSPATVNFNYEQVFVPGIDYNAALHVEELTERIGNKLVALNTLKTKNSPITNVFRIYNETSGEIYTVNRWNDNKIYFRYINPPKINQQFAERASFETIVNEILSVNSNFININSIKIYKIFLDNNDIINATEDGEGASFNSSLIFSNNNIFNHEIWFNNNVSDTININKIKKNGQYIVDYNNGIIWVGVSSLQDFNIGAATYKIKNIVPILPHVISVDDIYYRVSPLEPKNKQFTYLSFTDGSIIPEKLDPSAEWYLNNNISTPYQISANKIGSFIDGYFISGVTNEIKSLRSVFELNDVSNSFKPLDFSSFATFNDFDITVQPIDESFFTSVFHDSDGYYILLDRDVPYISPNITYNFSVIRLSDNNTLWDNTGTVLPGTPLRLTLPGIHTPNVGDQVQVHYIFTINNLSQMLVDYNKGDYFIDYTYLADEIIVSYEYGDNVIDFRSSKSIPEGTNYYVSYKAGALRDALLKNFGTLINIPELSNFDVDFDRERYRDALIAALSSFIQGPTINAIKNIGNTISHAEPEVIESIFQGWSLGNSLLFPEQISTTGEFTLLPAKYGNGVLIDSNQTISFPASSNLRLEEGTFETWIIPNWNGLDNNAELTFNIMKDGYSILENEIFVGAAEYHPDVDISGNFILNQSNIIAGSPNFNKDGVFIYYDNDTSGNFKRWYIRVIDGYVISNHGSYVFNINSTGLFYDTKSISLPKPANLSITTGNSKLKFTISSGTGGINEGITFLSDVNYYLLDYAEYLNKNRISLYKDPSGYFNFKVFDKDGTSFIISSDVSSWKNNELHHIAASWKINTPNEQDELHLFIDGIEVPNIIKYGQKLLPYLHEKFRTVDPEEVLGLPNRDIVGGSDLHTTLGSSTVTSSINFSAYNIQAGDKIFIDEVGFNPDGYTILSVVGQSLHLNANMPATLSDGRFSVNRTSYIIQSEINTVPNIAVSRDGYFMFGTISGSAGGSIVTSSINFQDGYVKAGYLIHINDPDLPITLNILNVSGTTLTLDTPDGGLPNNLSGISFWIYNLDSEQELPGLRAVQPYYTVSKDINFNDILTISNGVFAGDLILIRTLGLNFRKVRRNYYLWSNNVENILMTKMPAPISLDETNIKKIILPTTAISGSNSTPSGGIYTSIHLTTADGYAFQPSNSYTGRILTATISGTNVDFSTPVQVHIEGSLGFSGQPQTLTFNDYGSQDFSALYTTIDYFTVVVKPTSGYPTKAALNIEIKEKYSIDDYEGADGYRPTLRFAYPINLGYKLQKNGSNTVTDINNFFSAKDIGNYLYISNTAAAGYYLISDVNTNTHQTLTLQATPTGSLPLPNFTDGYYQILNTTNYRSGLQNGYFIFEDGYKPGKPHYLLNGPYEIEYNTYASIKFNSLNNSLFIGSSFEGNSQFNGIIDQIKIYTNMLTDTRIGETIPNNQNSITKDFNSLKALKSDSNTSTLINFDVFPFINNADKYIETASTDDNKHFHSSFVVNENFDNSLVITNNPIVIDNEGILDTKKEGTIEFWINPLYDTGNDPQERVYFDAFGAVVEEAISINRGSVQISAPASQILNVKLVAGDNTDYFAGGKLETNNTNNIREIAVSIGKTKVISSEFILQVSTVKIVGDTTETDYFADGTIGSDNKTIFLGKALPQANISLIITYLPAINNNDKLNTQIIRLNKALPNQNSKVKVTYIPKGLQGDRFSIYKDTSGYINFVIRASAIDYIVRAPILWSKNTWHRICASYKINGGSNNADEMRLFVDGYQYSDVTVNDTGLVAGSFPLFAGIAVPGDYHQLNTTIQFKDFINTIFIGSDYNYQKPAYILIDNLKISNISRPIYAPFGEPIDVAYSSNLQAAFPVTSDLYTTYLLDFDNTKVKNTDFTILKDERTGLFNFLVNIFDVFGLVSSSSKVQETLEKLIKMLKPANSRSFIKYFK